MFSDLRHAARTLAKSPGFTLSAIGALALGIGANTAVFSVVNQVLLNPTGVAEPARVVALRAKYDKIALKNIPVSVPDYADIANSTQLFESAAILEEGDFNYTGSGVPERLLGASVSYRWFDVFGAKIRLGRGFRPEEDQPNANQVVVLSFDAWKRIFGQDPGVLNRTIELNQLPYRIIGVTGPEFRWPAKVDLWAPIGLPPSLFTEDNRMNEGFEAVARLRPGVKFEQASSFVGVLNERLRNSGTRIGGYAKNSGWGTFLVPFTDYIAEDTKTPMLVLLGAVGFVLLIACSNIAGLMVARASWRTREIAIRAALGASRWDLIRQTAAESLLLAVLGAAAGLALANAGARAMLALAPQNAPFALSVRMDATVLGFTMLGAMADAILFGIAPAWQISRLGRSDALKDGGRSATAGAGKLRLRSALAMGQAALALVLLAGAGLLLRSLAALGEVQPGFDPAGVMTATITLPQAQYKEPAKQIAFFRAALSRLSSLPGATSVACGVPVPLSGQGNSASFGIEGRPATPGDPGPHGDLGFVSPDYFSVLKIPLRKGRVFTEQDTEDTEQVAIIDDVLARQYWPDEDPIGKHLRQGQRGPWRTVVGLVGHVKHFDLAADDVKGKYYFPAFQRPVPFATFLVRTQSDPTRLTGAIRQAVQAVDPALPVSRMRSMEESVAESLASRRLIVTLLGAFSGIALLMAVLGLYGVISYSVAQRTQELGIRMALGAQRSEVLTMVIGQGLRLAGAGAIVGLAASAAIGGMLRSQLFRVSPFDPLTLGGTAAVLIGAALLASYIPARRATRVDPVEALRHE